MIDLREFFLLPAGAFHACYAVMEMISGTPDHRNEMCCGSNDSNTSPDLTYAASHPPSQFSIDHLNYHIINHHPESNINIQDGRRRQYTRNPPSSNAGHQVLGFSFVPRTRTFRSWQLNTGIPRKSYTVRHPERLSPGWWQFHKHSQQSTKTMD